MFQSLIALVAIYMFSSVSGGAGQGESRVPLNGLHSTITMRTHQSPDPSVERHGSYNLSLSGASPLLSLYHGQ